MSEVFTALQVVMMPRDANPNVGMVHSPKGTPYFLYNTIFGGVILSYIDMAGAMAAKREALRLNRENRALFVTVAMNRIEFKKPVLVGDIVRFETTIVRVGRTSITVHVNVIAQRHLEIINVTEAEATFVGVDPDSSERRALPLLPEAQS